MNPTLFRPASFIEPAIGNLATALLLGAMLVLGVFLSDWGGALVAAGSILLSLLAAGTVLWLRSVTVNAIVLAGLVMGLGAILDDRQGRAGGVAGDAPAGRLRHRDPAGRGAVGALPGACPSARNWSCAAPGSGCRPS